MLATIAIVVVARVLRCIGILLAHGVLRYTRRDEVMVCGSCVFAKLASLDRRLLRDESTREVPKRLIDFIELVEKNSRMESGWRSDSFPI